MDDFYHSEDVIREVERRLDELKPFQYDSRCRTLLGDGFARKISDWERAIRDRKDDPLTLVVCGEFKRGKSSLINAILGEDVAPTNVTVETMTLNRISYGLHANEAQLSNGRWVKLTDEQLCREELEALTERTGESIRRLELKRPIALLKRITIVDTPGLGDAMEDFSELVDDSLKQADAVIYVFNVNYPLSRTEQLFLKTRILPQKYTELFLTANYCDMLPDGAGFGRMEELLRGRLEGLLPGLRPLMLSALDERCLQCGEERPNPRLGEALSENFSRLRGRLEELLEEKRYMVIPDRMQRMLLGMKQDLLTLLRAAEEGLRMSEEELRGQVETVERQCSQEEASGEKLLGRIRSEISRMREECRQWMTGLLDRMEGELDSLPGTSPEELTKYYTFYCLDLIQEGMSRCLELHTEALYDMLDEISSELTKALTSVTEGSFCRFRFALDNQTWTKGDNVSYVTSWLGLGALSLVTDGIAGAMRQKEMKDRGPELLKKIREQYPTLRNSTMASINESYAHMEKTVARQLREYHAGRLEAFREQAEQSALIARQSGQQKEETRELIEKLRALLEHIDRLDNGTV